MDLLDSRGIFAVLGPWVVILSLTLARVAGFVLMTPIFNSVSVPHQIKAAIVALLTVTVMFAVAPTPPSLSLSELALAGAVLKELMVGALIGFSVSVAMAAFHFGGQLIGVQMGFAMANVMDPTTHQQVGVMGQVLQMLAVMLFVTLDGHLHMVSALVESYRIVPWAGVEFQTSGIISQVVLLGGQIFSLGLRIALPIICVVLLINIGLATIARTVPQVNVFVLGFIFTVGLGLLTFSMSMPSSALVMERTLAEMIRQAFRFMRLSA